MKSILALLMVLVVGCGTTRNAERCLNELCSDPDQPFCDVTGSISGEPNSCISVECTPNVFEECRGDKAVTCNATGDNYDVLKCEFGCGPSGCIACNSVACEKRIVPRYLPNACEQLAQTDLIVNTSMTFDTDSSACSQVVEQDSGPDICLLKHRTITVVSNQTLTFTGSRAVAMVADYAFDMKGTIDVSANAGTNGPGGGVIKSGTTSTTAGGGGAGYRSPGGAGGDSSTDGGAANGGAAGDSPIPLVELFGGRQATQLAGTNTPGGGGGAVTLVSCRNKLDISGDVDAGGGGGASGAIAGADYRHPAGGGSGGTIVLQGLQMDVTGRLFANGGGGGGGGGFVFGGTSSAPGRDAERSTQPAAGGNGDSAGGAAGGNGGTISPPNHGIKSAKPGGGGGSAGYILVFTPQFILPTLEPSAVSPKIEERQNISTN